MSPKQVNYTSKNVELNTTVRQINTRKIGVNLVIKELREKNGLTQSELARLLKVNKSHVSRMERKVKGYRASYETIKLLSKHLKECPIKIFLFFSDIECGYIERTYVLRKYINCDCESCADVRVINVSLNGKMRLIKRKKSKLKRKLRKKGLNVNEKDSNLHKKIKINRYRRLNRDSDKIS
jgi:transcriptional regulator with XRE-family HTH domain